MALAIDQQHEKSELLNCRGHMPLIDVCTEEHQPSKKLLVSESGGFLAFQVGASQEGNIIEAPDKASPITGLLAHSANGQLVDVYCIEEMCQCKRTTCPL